MRWRSIVLGTCGALLASVVVVQAHHATAAEYDGTKPVTLRGTVTRVEWVNPHAWIYLDVPGPDGTVVKWQIQGGSPNVLMRRGLKLAALKVGAMLVVEGARARDGSAKINGRRVTLPDGRTLFVDTDTPPPPR